MALNELTAILADAAPGAPTAPGWTMLVLPALMVVMMYFAVFRPQNKKAKEHAALVQSLKAGDKIVTSSGIVGIVVSVKERTASIRSADTKLEILKSAVTNIERDAVAAGEN